VCALRVSHSVCRQRHFVVSVQDVPASFRTNSSMAMCTAGQVSLAITQAQSGAQALPTLLANHQSNTFGACDYKRRRTAHSMDMSQLLHASAWPSATEFGTKRGSCSDDEALQKRARYFKRVESPTFELPDLQTVDHLQRALVFIIQPFCHSGGGGDIVLYDGLRCRQLPPLIDPAVASKALVGNCKLVAKLPQEWRPVIVDQNRRISAAMLGVDAHATLYVLREEGQILAEASAVRWRSTSCKVIELHLLGMCHMPSLSDDQILSEIQWTPVGDHHASAVSNCTTAGDVDM